MPENSIDIVPVSDLFGQRFFVPDYQRGYRWTDSQINDLLDDIYEFSMEKDRGDFYCLQPLVIKELPVSEGKNYGLSKDKWFELIDGQQRLTTMVILYSYLGVKNTITIEYQTRKNTGKFLGAIATDGIDNQYKEKSQDITHIINAYSVIEKWFEAHKTEEDVREAILSTLIMSKNCHDDENRENDCKSNTVSDSSQYRPVKFIRFSVDRTANSIEIFERINIGKISLTNAELIKALFLQKSNYNENPIQRQIEIAEEWDRIEYSLQDDQFWLFINREENEKSSRIEFLFDFIYYLDNSSYPDNKDNYETFRYFYEKNKKQRNNGVFSLWKEIVEYYHCFWEWYVDKQMYHYVGFIIFQGKTDIRSVYTAYRDYKKSDFIKWLKQTIKSNLNIEYYSEKGSDDLVNYKVNLFYDRSSKNLLREFYLLLNIEFILNPKQGDYYRFPFDFFKKQRWDIEHIDSYTENAITREDDQKKWIEISLSALSREEQREYNRQINDNPNVGFSERRELIMRISGEIDDSASTAIKNSVGNLTLLDYETNRSYGNALFPIKRKEIIRRDSEGAYILPCTKTVFLKYFDKDCLTLTKWTKNDIQVYSNYIVGMLKEFLFQKESGNAE